MRLSIRWANLVTNSKFLTRMKNHTCSASLLGKKNRKEYVSFFPISSNRAVRGPHPSPGYCQTQTFQAEVTGFPHHLSSPQDRVSMLCARMGFCNSHTASSQLHRACVLCNLYEIQNYFRLPRVKFNSALDLVHLTIF